MNAYPVTWHAILRYLSRVHSVRLGAIEKTIVDRAGNKQLAIEVCRQLGLDLDVLYRTVLPEKFLPVLDSVTRIKLATHHCVISDGRVVTVLPVEKKRQSRILSRKELRRRKARKHGR